MLHYRAKELRGYHQNDQDGEERRQKGQHDLSPLPQARPLRIRSIHFR